MYCLAYAKESQKLAIFRGPDSFGFPLDHPFVGYDPLPPSLKMAAGAHHHIFISGMNKGKSKKLQGSLPVESREVPPNDTCVHLIG